MASWISQVIDYYGLTRIDMDIESGPAYTATANKIRLDALKIIRANPKYARLIISATVPADVYGKLCFLYRNEHL
jgi:chitinase